MPAPDGVGTDGPAPDAVATAGAALLERALTYTLGALQGAERQPLSAPTPCVRWRLGDLLAHVADSLSALLEAAEAGEVSATGELDDGRFAGDGAIANDPPVVIVRGLAHAVLGAWAGASVGANAAGWGAGGVAVLDRRLSVGLLAGAGAIEVATHGWDVALACGRRRPIPPVLAAELLDLARVFVTDADRPQRFAPQVRVPSVAAPHDRFVAFLGRDPG